MVHEGKWSFQRTLCFGLNRTVLQSSWRQNCTRSVCGHKIWWCLSLPVRVWCLTSCMIQAPCTAQLGLPLLPSTAWQWTQNHLWWIGSLTRIQASLFTWITMTFYFPPCSSKCWNICNFPQALLLPFPAHPVLAGRTPCSKISPGTWVHESKLDPAHCLFGWIFCPIFLPL